MSYTDLIAQLAAFPHIQHRLNAIWGSPECRAYLFELLHPARIDRSGFPFDALMTIQDLLELHDLNFQKYAPTQKPWDL